MTRTPATLKMITNIIDGTTPPEEALKATQDADGNVISSTYAKQNGTYANMTVGEATHAESADSATNATNVTTNINGQAIADIFEADGTTAKNATTAGKVGHALTIGGKTFDGSVATTVTKEDLGISGVYTPAGSSAFASLPTPAASNLGYVYNVTDAFTTDERFLEGAGKSYPAGTNVSVVENEGNYYYDVLGGSVDLSNYAQINGNYPNMTVGRATGDSNGDAFTTTYAKQNGTYAGMTVGNATNAETAAKVANSLTVSVNGTQTVYDGSVARAINIDTGGSTQSVDISIANTSWASNSVTLTASDYPAIADVTSTSSILLFAADASAEAFVTNGIQASGQAAGSVTISCTAVPAGTVTASLMICN